ncbi:serine hydrolase domain-containing protein [Actinacidiphila paucisporea]|uniref:CubicO group peptidase, beta-lactamase class C family n=1 Tax=Actinacidiphila paucisporea TaxID=310782 RepID=A0A1M7MXZ1_9ACTN|nr:serine hydrolase domain-containing protein [Actinacidiphila paucisporea]SHM95922.1 CubicO group peptidase, beta-lactamase class C family [Actinacidiphila paucisporea]
MTLRPAAPPDGTEDPAPLLAAALARVRAPDVVLAVSRDGRRTYATGGTDPDPAAPREELSFALGSLTKTFTVLLLAGLARDGVLGLDEPLGAHLPLPPGHARRITPRHLATHTSGLPRVPRDLIAGAVLHPYANGYAGYTRDRLLAALARTRVRHAPGTRRHYSNFGLALLGPALESAAGAPFPDLLADRVLRPLALTATTLGADALPPSRLAAVGRRGDGRTPLPPTHMAAFDPAGGLLSTPGDLLTYAEAHLRPTAALSDVQVPQLRRGSARRRETHTLTWNQHEVAGGPMLFHAGATFGQQCFLGFHPASRTAVAAFATRHDRTSAVVAAAHRLLQDLARRPGAR